MKPLRILCTGVLAGRKSVGQVESVLVYAVALRRLGHEVIFVDDVGAYRCRGADGEAVPFSAWDGRSHFESVMKAYGLWPHCCLLCEGGRETHGLSFAKLCQAARQSDLLLTRHGRVRTWELFESVPCRVYVDANPSKTQVLLAERGPGYQGLEHYTHFFTVGLNIGSPACPAIPTGGLAWHPICPPVDLARWPASAPVENGLYTTVSTWSGRSTLTWNGESCGDKADNWRRFIEVPKRAGRELEIALAIDAGEEPETRRLFHDNGWRLADPRGWSGKEDFYDYIKTSRGEFSVAHDRYVHFQDGWVSDRTARYLATGKPAIVQSTGFEPRLPVGRGLLTFRTVDEAVAALAEVDRDYHRHCRAAREMAEEYFDADKILARLLATVGVL